MPHLSETTVVHAPRSHAYREGEIEFFLDPEGPHWVAVDSRGAEILREVDGRRTFGELVSRYAARLGMEAGKAWLHVHDFERDVADSLLCHGFLGRWRIVSKVCLLARGVASDAPTRVGSMLGLVGRRLVRGPGLEQAPVG